MKKKEIIKAINAYSAILLRLKTMMKQAQENRAAFNDSLLINYLEHQITDVQKEMLDFISQNITTLEQ